MKRLKNSLNSIKTCQTNAAIFSHALIKTKNIKKTYNMNESVFFRLIARHSKYELCDSLDCHIQNDLVRFDSAYEKLKQKLVRIETLQNMSKN